MKTWSKISEKILFGIFSHVIKKYSVPFYHRDRLGILTRRAAHDNFRYIITSGNSCDAVPMMEKLEHRLGNIETAFDVGANIGITTAWMARLAQRVHAFEPAPDNLRRLRETLELNRCANVEVVEAALSDKDGMARLNLLEGYGHHSLGPVRTSPQVGSIEVRTLSLDSYCQAHAIERVDLLKIDVEGFEWEVLKGAAGLLAQKKIGLVVFEVSRGPLRSLGRSPQQLVELLQGHGYAILDLDFRPIEPRQLDTIEHADLLARPAKPA